MTVYRNSMGDLGTDTPFTLVTGTGTQLSESVSANKTLGSGAWSQITISASAPANAVYVVPRIKVSAASVSSAADLFFDELQLQPMNALSAWEPGQGQPIVSIVDLKEVVVRAASLALLNRNITMDLTQVGGMT